MLTAGTQDTPRRECTQLPFVFATPMPRLPLGWRLLHHIAACIIAPPSLPLSLPLPLSSLSSLLASLQQAGRYKEGERERRRGAIITAAAASPWQALLTAAPAAGSEFNGAFARHFAFKSLSSVGSWEGGKAREARQEREAREERQGREGKAREGGKGEGKAGTEGEVRHRERDCVCVCVCACWERGEKECKAAGGNAHPRHTPGSQDGGHVVNSREWQRGW